MSTSRRRTQVITRSFGNWLQTKIVFCVDRQSRKSIFSTYSFPPKNKIILKSWSLVETILSSRICFYPNSKKSRNQLTSFFLQEKTPPYSNLLKILKGKATITRRESTRPRPNAIYKFYATLWLAVQIYRIWSRTKCHKQNIRMAMIRWNNALLFIKTSHIIAANQTAWFQCSVVQLCWNEIAICLGHWLLVVFY